MFKKTTKSYTVDEIKFLLEKFCIYQDRCHQDIEKKMAKYILIQDAKDLILLHLMQYDFLNEERFTKSYVRGKFNQNRWGRNKIMSHLKSKQISNYNIKSGFKEIDEFEYLDVLKNLIIKKENVVNENNHFLKKKKVVSYLINKGYEYELINRLYKELFNF